jgi:hypothetical protein
MGEKGCNANRTDTYGNRSLIARRQLEGNGRKTKAARKQTKNWNRIEIG